MARSMGKGSGDLKNNLSQAQLGKYSPLCYSCLNFSTLYPCTRGMWKMLKSSELGV